MLNLYWKVFLGFWLSTIIIVSGATLVTHYLPVSSTHIEVTPPQLLLEQALASLSSEKVDGLRSWAKKASNESTTSTLLLNQQGKDLLSGEVFAPKQAELLALTKIQPRHGRVAINTLTRRYMAVAFRLPEDDKLLRLVIDAPNESSQLQKLFVRSLWPRLIIAVLLSGLVCYLLAGNFTVPIKQLRYATQQVASGNYDVRVSEHFTRTKDELDLLARDFDNMTEKVQKTLKNQERLIKDVSHELRSPLARLQVALGIAQQRYPAENMPELEHIEKEVHVLDELIEQILSLPQQDLDLTDAVDIGSLLHHVIDTLKPQAAEKKVTLQLTCESTEAVVRTRGRLLTGVFENLVQNAIRYSPTASIVTVTCASTGTSVTVDVRDEGPGVSDEDISHIFEPFYRASDARDRESGGYGLGLAIAQRSVHLHHGTIAAANTNSGLKVSVSLPLDGKTEPEDSADAES